MGWLSPEVESLDFVRTVTALGFSPTNFPMSMSAWSPVGESTSVTCKYQEQTHTNETNYFFYVPPASTNLNATSRLFFSFFCVPFCHRRILHIQSLVQMRVVAIQLAMWPKVCRPVVQLPLECPWKRNKTRFSWHSCEDKCTKIFPVTYLGRIRQSFG